MLNSESPNLTCMSLLTKKGINITDKNSIKAAASMSAAKANYVNEFKSYAGCILPSESLSTFGTNNASCQVANKYNLILTTDGVLDPGQNVIDGKAIYPNNGCMYNLNPSINPNPKEFIKDAGDVLDQQNQLLLKALNKQLSDLKSDCDKLDQNILQANQLLSDTQNKLSTQQSVCQSYIVGINKKAADIVTIKNQVNMNAAKLIERKSSYQKSICIGQYMAEKCNKEIRYCYVTEKCGDNPNWTDIMALKASNSRGNLIKLQGYIPTIVQKTISSLIIPPGIEVRIFDSADFIGGDTLYKAPLNSGGMDKICLKNDKYTTNILQKDFLGNITNINKSNDWDDKITSIRIRRNEKYEFIPGAVIESYVNYNDSVDSPLINIENLGNIDKYFYDPANPSVTMSGDDQLLKYIKYDSKQIFRGKITKIMPNTVVQSGSELNKYYTAAELSSVIPLQKCAKQCIDNGEECEVFTFDPTSSSCTLIKSQGEPLVLMDSTNSLLYVKRTPPVKLIDNRALPDGPYKTVCDMKTGTYDGIKLNINCPTQTNVSNNSSILTAECKQNTIKNNNGKLECDPLIDPGLNFNVYSGYFNNNLKFVTTFPIISSGTNAINGQSMNAFTNNIVLPDDRFTIEWTGLFKAKETGAHNLWVESDDLGYLWIGNSANPNNSTVDNALAKSYESWGIQTFSKPITLVKDTTYPIRIIFGGNGAPNVFRFLLKAPGMSDKTNNGEGYLFNEGAIPSKTACIVDLWDFDKAGNSYKFILPIDQSEITFDTSYNGPDADYVKWMFSGRISSARINDSKCECILKDNDNETLKLNFVSPDNIIKIYTMTDSKGKSWDNRASSLTIKRK